MQEDPRDTVRRLADRAGLPLSEERIANLALSLPIIENGIVALAEVDYADIEPAGAFRPRPERRQ